MSTTLVLPAEHGAQSPRTSPPPPAPAEGGLLFNAVSRFVDVRAGELALVRTSFLSYAGIIAAHTIVETARDTLFLTRLAVSRLALVYVVVAGAAALASSVSAGLVERIGRRRALNVTLLVASVVTATFHFLPKAPVVLFALYAWSALIGTLLVAQFWMLADRVFSAAQGKRLFGVIGAGGVVGAIVGGGLAVIALAAVPISGLLVVASAVFLATAVLLRSVPAGGACTVDDAPPAGTRHLEGALTSLRRHAHVRQMATLMVLSTLALLVAEYLFKTTLVQRVPAAALGPFLARLVAGISALSLAVQVLLTGRIIRHLGVIPALAMLPLFLGAASVGTVVGGGSLTMALLVKGADAAFRHSTHRVGGELLWMPLPPEHRERARVVLDSFGSRAVQALGAVLLLALDAFGAATPRVLATLTVVVCVAWLLVNLSVRGSYVDLLRTALKQGSLDPQAVPAEIDATSVEAVVDALSSRDPRRVIAAMSLLRDKKRERLIPGLVLYHESDDVVLHALRLASETGRRDWSPLVSRLLGHVAAPVRTAAVRVLANLGDLGALTAALSDENPAVRAYAAFCIAAYGSEGASDEAKVAARVLLEGEQDAAIAVALLGAIADHGDVRFADDVLALVDDPRPDVAAAAIVAMARVRDERFVPVLVARLARRAGRSAVLDALVHQGEPALAGLGRALRDAETPARVRLQIPLAIVRFGTQAAADLLVTTLAADPMKAVRERALRALGRLSSTAPARRERIEEELRKTLVEHVMGAAVGVQLERVAPLRLDARASSSHSLLLELVVERQRESLERVFRLLQILHPREELESVFRAVRRGDGDVLARAAELLEALALDTRRETRELLRLVLDDLPAEERVARARGLVPAPPADYEEAVLSLLRDQDDVVAALSAHHAHDLGGARLLAEVDRLHRERPYLGLESLLASRAQPRAKRHELAAERRHG